MSDNNGNEKKRSIGLYENKVHIVGRVSSKPKIPKHRKFTRVPLLIPSRRANGDTQWIPVDVDVVSDKYREAAAKVKPGDYFRCSAIICSRKVVDDDGSNKQLTVLQLDEYDAVGVVDGGVNADSFSPKGDDGMCVNDVMLLGRYVQRKGDADKGGKGPELREKGKTKYAFVNLVYNDPRNKDADGIWLDVSVFGPQAEIACQHMGHMDQVFVRGELGTRDTSYLVKGETKKELRVAAKPYGFQFVSLARRDDGGGGSAPKGPDTSVYEDEDQEF